MNPIDPTTPLAVTLDAAQWNQVLAILAEGPYRVVAPLIGTIGEQVQAAAARPSIINGEDTHAPH